MSKQDKYHDLMQTIKDDEEKVAAQNEETVTVEEIKERLNAVNEEKQSINEDMAIGGIVFK